MVSEAMDELIVIDTMLAYLFSVIFGRPYTSYFTQFRDRKECLDNKRCVVAWRVLWDASYWLGRQTR